MSRWIVLGVIAAAAFAAALAVWHQTAGSDTRPVWVERSEIIAIQAEPWPEGPQMPAFTRSPHGGFQLPLSLVIGGVPIPLPSPKTSGAPGGGGGVLTVHLRDGRVISYGPHDRPPVIDRLWGALLEARLLLVTHGAPRQRPALPARLTEVFIQRGEGRSDVFARHPTQGQHPLRLIADLLATALDTAPHPLPQPDGCHGDGSVVFRYQDGHDTSYGPCVIHPFMEMLWGGMQQAATQANPPRRRLR
jgi:hypothetical protein